jgi:zinc/manganese transport system substrate-binding protein/manganese/iron transport system substrate-binding protein
VRRRPDAPFGPAVLLLVALAAAACGPLSPTPSPTPGALRVVATTTVLADLVRLVGGGRVAVESLVAKGGEVHTFDPNPSDVRRVAEADLVVANGLGLDEWLVDLVADSGSTAHVVELGEDLEGVDYLAGGEEPDQPLNPHLWLDASYAAKYAERIGEALAVADPGAAAAHRSAAAAGAGELLALHEELRALLAAVPADARRVVSFHDAFPYFAAAYGLTIDGTIVDSPGQDPSAGEIAALIERIRASGARAILAEAQFSDELARAIAAETGAVVVSDLLTDSVGDAPNDTYIALMRWNTERVAAALGGPL